MRVTVERAALLKALGHVHRVVERRNTIPILSNILLRAGEAPALLSRPTKANLAALLVPLLSGPEPRISPKPGAEGYESYR